MKNIRGIVTGIAQTDEPDPSTRSGAARFFFPAATGTGFRCLGFVWQNGAMTRAAYARRHARLRHRRQQPRPDRRLGREHAWPTRPASRRRCSSSGRSSGNRRRERDPRAAAAARRQPSRAATAINDRGQVVGISGICDQAVGRLSAIQRVLWDRTASRTTSATSAASPGTRRWRSTSAATSSGSPTPPSADGGNFNPHAFLWTKAGGMRDLGTLPGDVTSQALGINEWRPGGRRSPATRRQLPRLPLAERRR